MHPAAYEYVAGFASALPLRVYEAGSRDVNGGTRDLFPKASWLGVDLQPGPGVDWVADCSAWLPEPDAYDLAICTEVLEHSPRWQSILFGMAYSLKPGGRLIVTCAGPQRRPHSARDGGAWLDPGEWYSAILPADLEDELVRLTLQDVEVGSSLVDVLATAVRR